VYDTGFPGSHWARYIDHKLGFLVAAISCLRVVCGTARKQPAKRLVFLLSDMKGYHPIDVKVDSPLFSHLLLIGKFSTVLEPIVNVTRIEMDVLS
jgi:hypothetical protein